MKPTPPTAIGSAAAPSRAVRLLILFAFFALVWSTKLFVIDRFGSDLPFWDQWEREGAHVLRAWTENGDLLRALFTPHNEHRIAPTLATNLALTALGGQWDARIQCLVSAALHVAVLAGLFLWSLHRFPLRWALLAGGLLAALGASPIVWENLLSGFQSQFYFLAGFSFLALHSVLSHRALSLRWSLGLLAGTCALVSMGSGLLWTAPALLVSALRLRSPSSSRRETFLTLGAVAALLALGLALHTSVSGHNTLRAASLGTAIVYALRCLSWPVFDLPWLAFLLWAPWIAVALQCLGQLRRRTPLHAYDEFLLAAGGWVLLQVAAVAYSRAAGGELPANRYGDLCGFGLALSVVSLARVGSRLTEPLPFVGAWTLLTLGCLATATHAITTELLPHKKSENVAYERNVHAFVLDDDFAAFARQKENLPFPNAEWLAEVLRRPGIRALLPGSVRAPLALPDFESPTPPPAPTPPLTGRATRTVDTPGEWKSAELPAARGYWKFEVAGQLGAPGTSLQLVSLRDNRVLATIAPTRLPGQAWRAVYVRAPAEPARLVARTDAAARWFAFSAPTEISTFSYVGRAIAKAGWETLVIGLGLLAAAGFVLLRRRRAAPAAENPLSDRAAPRDIPPKRMRLFTFSTLLAALLASVVLVVPFLPAAKSTARVFAIEARVRSNSPGNFQIYYDNGAGISENHAGRAALVAGATTRLTIPVTAGSYRLLRVDPIDGTGAVTIESLRVISLAGWTVAELPLTALKPHHQIASARLENNALHVVSTPTADDPQLLLEFNPPLAVDAGWRDYQRGAWRYVLPVFAVFAALLFFFDRSPLTRAALTRRLLALRERPAAALALTAAVAVTLSAYPVIFLGKSFVSPNFGTPLLYDEFPTLPGYKATETVDAKMSDVGAIIWQHVPFSMFQQRALAHGELPLWNRYNAGGVPLLAQGQSMFGDPLHFFVIAARGASWAWDAKYLLAKWLFATGLALTVLALLAPGGAPISNLKSQISNPLLPALLVAAAAPFIGFFVYRLNHPAFFSLCYAPWPLYCLVRISRATTRRGLVLGCIALIFANLALMNSGTVKEAYMLLLCMNLAGSAVLLSAATPLADRLRKLGALAVAGLVFVLLTAPIWATFLQTLKSAYTGYNAVSAYQIQPSLLLGLFDEIFYRILMSEDRVFNPSLNFVLLLGLLYFVVTLRRHFAHRAALALAVTSLLPLGLAFGLISPHWIVRLPFLANVAHVDNTFSCVLIVLWSVLAGLGFATALSRLGTREGRQDLILVGVLLGALVFGWLAFGHAAHRPIVGPTVTVNQPGQTLTITPFIREYLVVLLIATALLLVLLQRAATQRRVTPATLIAIALCVVALVWRLGFHADAIGFETFTARPPVRAPFHAKSSAMDFARAAHAKEPGRGYGTKGNFFPGWTGVYGLETVHGPDALVNPWIRELIGVSGVERIWDWRLYCEPEQAAKARPFFDALNVRFYFDNKSRHPSLTEGLRLVHSADLDVYESPTAWPRAFFTDRLEVYEDPAELIPKFAASNGRPFAAIQRSDLSRDPRLALLNSKPQTPNSKLQTTAPAAASDYRLTENNTSFRVRAGAPGVIVLTEAYWPGDFVAELNGRRAPVLRLNHAFKGILVETPGDYAVTVRYWPKNFTRNLILSALAALSLGVALFFALRPTRSASSRATARPRVDLPAPA